MKVLPLEAKLILLEQENLLTRHQLQEFGFSSVNVASAIQRQQWSLVTTRVVHLSPHMPNRRQELLAASLHFDHLVLTGVAALEFEGLQMNHDRRIDLIGPRGGRTEPLLNTVIHTTRRPLDLHPGFPTRTSHALSVVHAMAWAPTQKQARHIAYWAIQRDLVSLSDLSIAVCSNRRSQIIKLAIGRVLSLRDGVDTVHEHLFLKLCSEFGLPEPDRKPEFLMSDGIAIHPDFGFSKGDKYLAVEIDGVQHYTPGGLLIDAYRMEALDDLGVTTYRISNKELDENPTATMRALKFALRRM